MLIQDIITPLIETRKKRRGFRYPAFVGYGGPSGSGTDGGVGSDGTSGGVSENTEQHINWAAPNADFEHHEIAYQLQLKTPSWVRRRLRDFTDKNTFIQAVNTGEIRTLNRSDVVNAGNTGDTWADVVAAASGSSQEQEKVARAPELYTTGKPVERPIYLENPKTHELWLIAGHHRSTYVTDVLKQPLEAVIII